MVHRVKCDGEIFNVPGGLISHVLSNLSKYQRGEDLNYQALKADIKKEKIPNFKEPLFAERMGYLDFDQLRKVNGGFELPTIGNYMMIVDRKQYDKISIVEHQETA